MPEVRTSRRRFKKLAHYGAPSLQSLRRPNDASARDPGRERKAVPMARSRQAIGRGFEGEASTGSAWPLRQHPAKRRRCRPLAQRRRCRVITH